MHFNSGTMDTEMLIQPSSFYYSFHLFSPFLSRTQVELRRSNCCDKRFYFGYVSNTPFSLSNSMLLLFLIILIFIYMHSYNSVQELPWLAILQKNIAHKNPFPIFFSQPYRLDYFLNN